MSNATINNGQTQRKQLSAQLDRLDAILDGLAEALNESVADAVRDVVGQVVRESVETTIREVLGSPELLRAALAAHAQPQAEPAPAPQPEATPPELRPSLTARIYGAVRQVCARGREKATQAGEALSGAWSWSLNKLRAGCGRVKAMDAAGANACRLAWRFRAACAGAVGAGVVTGVGAYLAGLVAASLGCGVAGAALVAAGIILWPVWQLLRGSPTSA